MRLALLGLAAAAVLLYEASLPAWTLVAVSGAAGVLATRTWGRAVAGVALAVSGVAVAVPEWPDYAGVAGGVVLAATGAYVAARGPRWRALGTRYEAPSRQADPWAALDRGEDPTL